MRMQIHYYIIVVYISRPCSRFRFSLTKFSNKKINGSSKGDGPRIGIQTILLFYILLHLLYLYICVYDAAVLAVTERSLCAWDRPGVGPTTNVLHMHKHPFAVVKPRGGQTFPFQLYPCSCRTNTAFTGVL